MTPFPVAEPLSITPMPMAVLNCKFPLPLPMVTPLKVDSWVAFRKSVLRSLVLILPVVVEFPFTVSRLTPEVVELLIVHDPFTLKFVVPAWVRAMEARDIPTMRMRDGLIFISSGWF